MSPRLWKKSRKAAKMRHAKKKKERNKAKRENRGQGEVAEEEQSRWGVVIRRAGAGEKKRRQLQAAIRC